MQSFDQSGLAEPIQRTLAEDGYHTPTPIQGKAIPPVLLGRDLMGCAQTGTGKTAAFALPMLHRLATTAAPAASDEPSPTPKDHRNRSHRRVRMPKRRPIRALILAPTRELAAQITQSVNRYSRGTGLRATAIYGGVGQGSQVRALRSGIDVLVATPGRLLDLMEQQIVDLRRVEMLILDEADQMLDMGFIEPLREIVASVPGNRQTLMFSATMPPEIRRLAGEWLRDPDFVEVGPVATPIESVQQSVYFVPHARKLHLLTHCLTSEPFTRLLVFARTKMGVDGIVEHLEQSGIRAAGLHGNKSQFVRQRTLEAFKSQQPPVLVATDIAARGLDVKGISHVINFDLPEMPEVYVHRIGRTGRAGSSGVATSFCAHHERYQLKRIEQLTRRRIAVVNDHPELETSRPSRDRFPRRPSNAPRPSFKSSGRSFSGHPSSSRRPAKSNRNRG